MAHDRRKSEPGQYKCKACGQTFKTAEELKDHELKLHSSDIQPESEGSTAGQSRIKR
jgi:hypothetical protein